MLMKLRYHFLLLSCVFLSACAEVDEEALLNKTLDDIVVAVESRSVRKVNRYLTSSFKTNQNTGVNNVQHFMVLHFRSSSVIHIFTSERQLAIKNEYAKVSFNALVTGSSHWIPERGQRFLVKTEWKKAAQDWKLDKLN